MSDAIFFARALTPAPAQAGHRAKLEALAGLAEGG